VRVRIERVAATGFTVLIEGGIDPQARRTFIEVSLRQPSTDGYGAMERA
jgi:hypothetical protein